MTDDETDRALRDALAEIPADPASLSARVLTRLAEPAARPALAARLLRPLPLAGTGLAALACAGFLGYTLTPGGHDVFTALALGGLAGGF
ncbi:hypothetical protein [Vannielia litorea]|uniref:Uncharacterized protein n=1 Tax=Vannielia litorea TaxID=1217970 RepID=A0A1N6EU82_9RHOB|nr:hypothetical protein [Vannielia litorea]SIN86521.1 hypothetical protein SAMN05444002_1102 [Vannielia litorea]